MDTYLCSHISLTVFTISLSLTLRRDFKIGTQNSHVFRCTFTTKLSLTHSCSFAYSVLLCENNIINFCLEKNIYTLSILIFLLPLSLRFDKNGNFFLLLLFVWDCRVDCRSIIHKNVNIKIFSLDYL